MMSWRSCTALVSILLCAGCGSDAARDRATSTLPPPVDASAPDDQATADAGVEVEPVVMPDLVGLTEVAAQRRVGDLQANSELRLGFTWSAQAVATCDVAPGTVVLHRPGAGATLAKRTEIVIRTAYLDLDRFRGPCDPSEGQLGPVRGADAETARQFYRFAADPTRGARFVRGDVWIGIEDGLVSQELSVDQLADLGAWQLGAGYAERSGPFSALDIMAESGGYYEVHRGVLPPCGRGNHAAPRELTGLRAITLTAPRDTISACMQWWGVSLFLDDHRIRGVALRLGSP